MLHWNKCHVRSNKSQKQSKSFLSMIMDLHVLGSYGWLSLLKVDRICSTLFTLLNGTLPSINLNHPFRMAM